MMYSSARKTFMVHWDDDLEEIGDAIDWNLDSFGHAGGGLYSGIVKLARLKGDLDESDGV